jgi:hypothetical protein
MPFRVQPKLQRKITLTIQEGKHLAGSILVATEKIQKIHLEIIVFKVFLQEIKNKIKNKTA